MDFQHLLLSFDGRTRRLHFWLVGIGLGIVSAIIQNLTWGPAYVKMVMGQGGGGFGPVALIGMVLCALLMWPSLANSVKRLHDRDKSGWWILAMGLASITVIGILWPLIELGFLDGTPGPNRFGPSPKGLGAETPAPAA